MNQRGKNIILLLFLILPALAYSQLEEAFFIESSFHAGRIVKHRETINFPVDGPSFGIELSTKWQSRGKKEWQQFQGYPAMGFSLLAMRLGDKDVLGSALGIFPNLSINLVRKKEWQLLFQMGTGMAWLTSPFDQNNNPENNAISSNINNVSSIKFYLRKKLNKKIKLLAGFSFTHFSNGGSKLPNLGINIPSFSLGILHSKEELNPIDFYHFDVSKKTNKKIGLEAYGALAYQEIRVAGGPRYPVYIAGIAGQWSLSKVNRLKLGYEYEFNKSMLIFGRYISKYNSDKEANQGASRHMIYLGDEFLFGDWACQLQAGIYLFKKQSLLLPKDYYFKLTTKYYLPPFGNPSTRFYLRMAIKSHLFVADYLSLGLGAAF